MADTLVLNADAQPMFLLPDLPVVPWTASVSYVYSDKVSVVAEYDDWEVHSPSVTMKVPSILLFKGYAWWERNAVLNPENLFLRDNHTCQLQIVGKCARKHGKGHPKSALTMDHYIPKSKGGRKEWSNIVTACRDCNNKRGNDMELKSSLKPYEPSYYELLEKRKRMPLYIRDEAWLDFFPEWDRELVFLKDRKGNITPLK